MDIHQIIVHLIYFCVFITIISSWPMNELLFRISILVASTKTVGLGDCFFFQDRMHDLLDLIREFSLVLLCSARSEACPIQLKNARFWPVQAKASGIYGRNIPLSRPTTHSAPTTSTRRMPFTEEKRCDYDLRHDSCAIQASTNIPAESHSKLFFMTSAPVRIFYSHQKPQPS
jgi:hypothetical protein